MTTHSKADLDDDLGEPELSDPGQIPISALANDRIVQATPDVTIRQAAKQLADEGRVERDGGLWGVQGRQGIHGAGSLQATTAAFVCTAVLLLSPGESLGSQFQYDTARTYCG